MTTTEEDKKAEEELRALANEVEARWNWYFTGLPIVALFVVIETGPNAESGHVIALNLAATLLLVMATIAGVIAQWTYVKAVEAMSLYKRDHNITVSRDQDVKDRLLENAQETIDENFRNARKNVSREHWARRISYVLMALGLAFLVAEYVTAQMGAHCNLAA